MKRNRRPKTKNAIPPRIPNISPDLTPTVGGGIFVGRTKPVR